jgi:molybdate transport system substrate-binding protein
MSIDRAPQDEEQTSESRVVTGISSMATRHVLNAMSKTYAQQAGRHVDVVSVGGVEAARRVRDGEAFDFVVLAADVIDQLATSGRVDPGSRTDLVRSGIAMAVAGGAPKPEIGSERAVRDAVQAARAIGYSTGPSGGYVARLLERWGILDANSPRLVQAAPGVPVGALIASGEVTLGFQQLSELMHVPGIDVVGVLPPDIQLATVFSGAVCSSCRRPASTKALLAYFASPTTDEAKRRHGLQPAR